MNHKDCKCHYRVYHREFLYKFYQLAVRLDNSSKNNRIDTLPINTSKSCSRKSRNLLHEGSIQERLYEQEKIEMRLVVFPYVTEVFIAYIVALLYCIAGFHL